MVQLYIHTEDFPITLHARIPHYKVVVMAVLVVVITKD